MAPFEEDWQLYRKMVDNNFLFHREAYAQLHDILMKEVDRPFRFLDIACGDASASVQALKGTRVNAYYGLDLSRPALQLAAESVETLNCPCTLQRGDFAGRLLEGHCTVDVAWIGLSLHHLLRPAKLTVMKTIRRVLSEDGLLLIYEPTSLDGEDRDGWLRRYARQKGSWSAYSGQEWDAMWAHTLAADFPETETEWRALGDAAGFKVTREVFASPTNLLRMYCFAV